jgi:hypothetical protein
MFHATGEWSTAPRGDVGQDPIIDVIDEETGVKLRGTEREIARMVYMRRTQKNGSAALNIALLEQSTQEALGAFPLGAHDA